MRANTIQTNFTSGEVSPLMYGRIDVNKYANGAKTLQNFIVRPQGGACRRPGTQYINAGKLGTYIRMIPFVISNQLAYQLEFGNLYIRFYTGGGIVGGGSPVEVVTPYLSTDLDKLYFAQSADELFLVHPNYPPQVLTRLSNTSWTLTKYVSTDGPYLDIDTTGNQACFKLTSDVTTITSNFSGSLTILTATDTIDAPFVSGSVGKYIDFSGGGFTGGGSLFLIGTYTSTSVVTGNYIASNLVNQTSLSASFFSYAGGVITSTFTYFNPSFVGQYVQIGASTQWYLITAYTSGTHVSATPISTVALTIAHVVITGSGAFVSASIGTYVEYVVDGVFYLAKILSVISPTQATVQILPQILVNSGEFDIKISGSSITTSYSGIFSQSNVGMYVRSTSAQAWSQITAFVNTSSVTGTVLTMFSYNYPSVTMTLQDNRIITGSLTFTSSTFQTTDVGTQYRLQFGSQWRCFVVTAVVSTTTATGTLNDSMPYDLINALNYYNNGFADNFRAGAWSVTNGYPSVVVFNDQRLVFANSTLQPSTAWFSQSADFYNMAPTEEDSTVIATDAIYVTIASGNVDPITWLRSGQVLLLGTFSGEYEIVAPAGGGISPTNISISKQSTYGSLSPTIAYGFGVATIFLQRGGNKIREMVYQFQFNAFNSKDISIISEHIMRIRGGAKIMGYQVDPVSIFWIVCNNGQLVSCTYDRDQDIIAFTQHVIAGGTVESVCVTPNTTRDDVYLSVNRTINGSTVRYIEVISPFFDTDTGDTLTTMNFLDCSNTYVGGSTSTISNLNYLIGQSVYANVNGIIQGPFTVSGGGTITLTSPGTNVVVGLNYTSTFQSLSPEGGSQRGTSQGKRKRISELITRVKDSLPFKHGPALAQLTKIDAANFGGTLLPSVSQNQLTTGDIRFTVDMAYDTGSTYYIVQDMPYPLTLVALMPDLETNE